MNYELHELTSECLLERFLYKTHNFSYILVFRNLQDMTIFFNSINNVII